MRRFFAGFLTLLLTLSVQAQQVSTASNELVVAPINTKVALEDGTPVKLRLSRNVSSADAKTGDTVDFEVLEEVRVGDVLLIPKGGIAWGTVTEAEHKKRIARGGKLDMTIDAVRLADGEKAALRGVREAKGGGHTGAMTAGIVVTGLIVWPAAPFFLFMHGKDITIPKGTEITAYINGTFPLEQAKFVQQTAPSTGIQLGAAAAQNESPVRTTLEISSTPPGADIELDGNFVGNTPSSVGVSAGDHTVRLTKSGFAPWERRLKTSTGAVNIAPELEPVSTPRQVAAGAKGRR